MMKSSMSSALSLYVCYADDIALLAPSPSALRMMLSICEEFALTHGLKSNAAKTQLIHFSQHPHSQCDELFLFCGSKLNFTKEVTHLGHILTQDLDGSADISRAIRDLVRKVNYILCTFLFVDPSIKCTLIKSYCLSLYGSQLCKYRFTGCVK